MNKSKRRIIVIIASSLIIILITISLVYFNTQENNVEIKSLLKEYNAELQENENMHLEEDASGDKVPVPNGYVGSRADGENEIDTGYVIYEGTEEVTDENVEEAQKTRNQYVWIPVPDVSTMYGTDENGKKWGKIYNFATSSSNANYNELTGAYPNNWSESDGVMKINKSVNREPDYANTNYDMSSAIKVLDLGAQSTYEWLIQLEREFNSMIESVEKYNGFYIGRYETGNLSKNIAVVVKENSDIKSIGKRWYNSYKLSKTLSLEKDNVVTGMIWGCQWDRVLIWLVESKNRTIEQICDSKEWGNYAGTWAGLKVTGYSEEWKVANIYDLAGNVNEWTMENGSWGMGRVTRGNAYWNSTSSVSNRTQDSPYGSNSYGVTAGSRAMLYIK